MSYFCRGKVEEREAELEKFLPHPYAVFKSKYFEISAAHICSVLWNITPCCLGVSNHGKFKGLLESIIEHAMIFRNIGGYLPVDADVHPRRPEY
jgi:hypothetical protein